MAFVPIPRTTANTSVNRMLVLSYTKLVCALCTTWLHSRHNTTGYGTYGVLVPGVAGTVYSTLVYRSYVSFPVMLFSLWPFWRTM